MIVAHQKFLKEVFDDFLLGVMLDHNTLSLKNFYFFIIYNLLFFIRSKRLLRPALLLKQNLIEKKTKLIILEKPVASNLKDSYFIKEKSENYNVPILVNHPRRYSNDYIKLKEIIQNQYIGNIHSVNVSLWSGLEIWKKECEINGNCSLIHDGTHIVDILHYLFNIDLSKPIIDKIIYNSENSEEIDSIYLHYKFDTSPYIIYVELSGNKKFFGVDMDIRGNIGRIIIGNGYFKIYKREKSKLYLNFYSLRKKFDYSKMKLRYFSNMVNNAINFIENKEKLLSTLDDGIKDLEGLYIIYNKFK